jgi:hypothetical protein
MLDKIFDVITTTLIIGTIIGSVLFGLRMQARGEAMMRDSGRDATIYVVNQCLKEEGYKIYFRVNEEDRIALVHPR